jgi:hypothetical protein
MKATTLNPYRILGVLAGATNREIIKQSNNLKRYLAADAELPDDYSFAKIDNFQHNVEMIDDAIERNDTDPEKIENALFWFWKGYEITDEPAFDALKEGDVEKAFNIWFKLIIHKDESGKLFWTELTKKNFSAYHNIAVLKLTGKTDKLSFVSAVKANIKFIESEYFAEFVKSVTDETYRANKKDIELLFLEKITNSIAEKETKTTLSKLVKYLNGYNFAAKADFIKSISKLFADNIKTAITTCENARNASKTAVAAGATLYKNTKNDLTQLKAIFGEQDFSYSNVADKVANEILQCSIDYFNEMQNKDSSVDYQTKATDLVKLAQSVAVGSMVKGRCKENLQTLEEMKNREIKAAIQLLQSVKDAYEQACKQIDEQVEELQLDVFSINWSKVNKMKRNCINWRKVNDLLKKEFTDENIDKIKDCTNETQKQKFVELAEWINEHSRVGNKLICSVLDSYSGKKEGSTIKKFAWYNNPKNWDTFGGWTMNWLYKISSPDLIQIVWFLVWWIVIPMVITVGLFYCIYRISAFVAKIKSTL